MNRNEIVDHIIECLKQLKEEEKPLVVPENEIVFSGSKFFLFPRHVRIKSSDKKKWMVGTVKDCRRVKYYYTCHEDCGPEMPMGDLIMTHDFYYEVD
jgi:hypothetical protein